MVNGSPNFSFEATVLSALAKADLGQEFIKEKLVEVQDDLKLLHGSVTDLYQKHFTARLDLEKYRSDCPLTDRIAEVRLDFKESDRAIARAADSRISALERNYAVAHSKLSGIGRVFTHWYHWLILVLASLASTFILNKIKLIK